MLSGRRAVTAGAVCLALVAGGCGDDEDPEDESPRGTPAPSSATTTAAPTDRPAFHVAGRVVGDASEEFGLIHDGDIVSVEFTFRSGPDAGRQELIESVLATVELR